MGIGELLYATVGQAIVRALVKSWTGDSELLADSAASIGGLLAEAGFSGRDRRRIERELDEVTEQVSDRLTPFFEAERYGGLPVNEGRAAAIAVAQTIDRGYTSPDVALASDLDATRLEDALRKAYPDAAARASLEPLARRLYDVALRESCAYLVQMAEDLPKFHTQAFGEILARERRIIELLTKALDNLPRTDEERALEFETRYMRQVANRLDRLELMGFGAAAVYRYALSVAYISLTATVARYGDASDDVGDQIAEGWEPRSRGSAQSQRVDGLLEDFPRLLVTGDAGSGKTTLLQWLAVNAAKRTFEGRLADLNDSVPFFIQLRRYADGPLPAPEAFVDQVAHVVSGLMPQRWVEGQLAAGRALVLIDGVDELPATRREEVSIWLEDLCRQYPYSHYVVTSRPPAVADGWLSEDDFDHARLEPMSMRDVEAFIDHWYKAAAPQSPTDAPQDIAAERDALVRTIRRSSPLRRLATSPLLCALLCALHRDGNANLPADRVELYELALAALLERRDAQRRVPDSTAEAIPQLNIRRKQLILQKLAYWLVRNGYTDAPRDLVLEVLGPIVERVLPGASPGAVFDHLLERTGLLREPVLGRIDFIHRTFLEYLAAVQAISDGDVGVLLQHASDDDWAEIVVLAAGVANPRQQRELIVGLLELAERHSRSPQRLQLLAVACMETAPGLEPPLRERLAEVLGALVPPANLPAAQDLAAAGHLAVPLLGAQPDQTAVEARMNLETLRGIGTDEALEQIATYASDRRISVIRDLLWLWPSFDRFEYARIVLASSPLDGGRLSIVADGDLSFLPLLRGLSTLTIETDDVIDMRSVGACARLRRLDVRGGAGVFDLRDLAGCQELEQLTLAGFSSLEALDGVQRLSKLRKLSVSEAPLVSCTALSDGLDGLTDLHLDGVAVSDLSPLAGLRGLKSLFLRTQVLESEALLALAELEELEDVSLDFDQDVPLFPLIEATGLRRLVLAPGSGEIEFVPLGRPERPLEELVLVGARAIHELERVAEIGPVRRLTLDRLPIESLDGLPDGIVELRLMHLDSLSDVGALATAPSLEKLTVLNCAAIDKRGLRRALPADAELTIQEKRRDETPATVGLRWAIFL
jgi:NACHT domain